VGAFGTPALLVVSALAVAASLGVLSLTLRYFPLEAAPVPVRGEDSGRAAGLGELLRSRYAWLLFQLVAISYLGYYVLDNLFYTVAETRHPDAAELAGFLGAFWCVVSSITLLSRSLLTSRVLSRHGLLGGLVALPVAVGLGAVVVGVGSGLGQPLALVFWAIAASRLFDQVLRESVDLSAVLVLYQPLAPAQRVGAQTAVEGIVGPLAGGAAGLVLLVAIRGLGFGIPQLSLLLIGVVCAWLAVAVRLRRAYTGVLSSALARRRLGGHGLSLGDASSLEVLQRGLESPHPGEVAYCLDVLEDLRHPSLSSFVTGLLGHPVPDVRRDALLRVERLGLAQALWAVRESASSERTPAVLGAGLRALAAVGDDADIETVLERVDDPDPAVRTGARVALLRNGGIEGVLSAGQRLMQQAGSAEPGPRAEAARLIGEVGVPSFYRPLLALARDPDPDVRRVALHSAGRLDNPRLWPLALDALPDPRFRSAAVGALCRWGDAVVPLLEAAFDQAAAGGDRVTPRRLVRLCGQIRSPRSLAALWHRVGAEDPGLRQSVLATLVLCGYRPDGEGRRRVWTRLDRELAQAEATVAAILDVGSGSSPVLARGLEGALDAARDRILSLLALVHTPELVQRARVNLRSRMAEKRAQAVELIDSVLRQRLSDRIVPLLEDQPHAARLERVPVAWRPARLPRLERLRALASGAEEHGAWCRACAIQTLAEEGLDVLAGEVSASLGSADPLVAETGAWAAARMGLDVSGAGAGIRARVRAFAASRQGGGRVLSTVEKVIILKSVDIFSETPDEVLAEVAPLLEEVEFEPGRAVFEKGDMGSALYVVIDGRVRVHDGTHTLRELGPRDIFGEMAALDPEPRSASVTATEPTRLFRLEQEGLYDLMADRIEVVRGVIRVLCQRLRVRAPE
jgi:hypothetical protein